MSPKEEILVKIKHRVLATEPGATVILYGSYARGDNRKDSDIDILILLDRETISREDEKRIAYPLYELEFDSGRIISPLVFSRNDWITRHKATPFFQSIQSEGREL